MAWILSVGSGVLLLIAFPGSGDLSWLAFVALVPLIVAIAGATRRRAAALGFVSGLVFWGVTFAWPAPWVMRFGDIALHRGVLTGVVLVSFLSLYTAAFAALMAGVRRRPATVWVLAAACFWVALEFARTYLLSGFPWNLLGYTQYRTLPLIQIAAVTGVWGVSFVVAAINAGVAGFVLSLAGARTVHVAEPTVGRVATVDWRHAFAGIATGAMIFALALAAGSLVPGGDDSGPRVTVAIAQGNIDQSVKWDPAFRDVTFGIYRDLTRQAAQRGVDVIVWPETSVPLLERTDPHWNTVTDLARETNRFLVVGAPDRINGGEPRNSVFLFGPDGAAIGRYDKRHLLPFGEYLPPALSFLRVFGSEVISEFSPGTEPAVTTTPFGRLANLVCFEVIFPGEVRERFAGGADVLINLTNDAWFGRSQIPQQHLAAAVFRAVENRTWLVRAANSGISAIVAPDGRIEVASKLFTAEVVTGTFGRRTVTTPYTQYGDVLAWLAAGVTLAYVPLPVRRRRSIEQPATAT
ncbi:MAG: apolipoprotein N-acyltransferase [Candidatus Rokubacteria bacterium]|nr:apolipoprotein N-acyltransferase [Candidatus Rokubacteria bacterium]